MAYHAVIMRQAHIYRIYNLMQIVYGKKFLQLHTLLVIRGKSFAIVWPVATSRGKYAT